METTETAGPLEAPVRPLAWIRLCSDGGYEGPIADCDKRMDEVRRGSGAWTPLYAIPDGWQLVPKVATQEMSDAGRAAFAAGGSVPLAKVYRLMVAAAPTPNARGEPGGTNHSGADGA
jgi:hypothetical protein